MKTVHFTDLREYAATTDTLQRGLRYLRCHDSRDDTYNFAGDAHCYEELTASHVQDKSTSIWTGRQGTNDRVIPMYAVLAQSDWHRDQKLSWNSASDSGLFVYGARRSSRCNYLLEINGLLREGIVIDTTPIPRDPDQPSWTDKYHYF